MIISSRQAIPNMSLRRTAALHSPGLSSRNTLSIPLIDSPLPSPVLPSIVPSHGKPPPGAGKRKAYRVFRLLVVCALFVALFRTSLLHSLSRWRFIFSDSKYQLPATIPITVTPLIVKNRHGHRKWTIHIPADTEFPLSPPQITELCSRCSQMSQQNFDGKHASFDYSRPDPNFLDINDINLVKSQSLGDPNKQNSQGSNVFCDKSLTFVLQANDGALGVTLMKLWISYGLARRQGRSFFIDDTNWAYGEFSMYFKPPPKPTCEQPPSHWRLPCPLQAKHLIVSSSNTPWVFGESFQKYFQGRFSVGETQQKELFDMARHGYEELFHLAGEDATYYHQRIRDFHKDVHSTHGITIGIHVRHGDSHPLEAQYRDSYIPLDRYAKRASSVFHAHLQQAHGDTALFQSIATNSKVILASDDPEVYRSMELGGAERAQNYIALASKAALDAATDMSLGSHLDENIGWEGGFFQDMFWSLGVDANDYSEIGGPFPSNQGPTKPKTLSSQSIAAQNHLGPSNQSLKLREWIARAYLLDLAVLGQSDRTVCDVSSASCRLLAVMMGWDKAIVREFWQNIDGNWHWSFDMP